MKQFSCALFSLLITLAPLCEIYSQELGVIESAYSGEKKESTVVHNNDLRPPTGCIGPTGPTGERGPTGDIGFDGPVGATGPQGLPGITGPNGNFGALGNTGPTGPRANIREFAYFSKTNSLDVPALSSFDFQYISPLNSPNIVYDSGTRLFSIGVGGNYLVNYIVTPQHIEGVDPDFVPLATGFQFNIITQFPETIYKILPEMQGTNISVMRGQFIRFFPSNSVFSFENLTTTSAMHFDNDAGFGPFASANVASIIFIKLD